MADTLYTNHIIVIHVKVECNMVTHSESYSISYTRGITKWRMLVLFEMSWHFYDDMKGLFVIVKWYVHSKTSIPLVTS